MYFERKSGTELVAPLTLMAIVMVCGLLNLSSSTATSGFKGLLARQFIWDMFAAGIFVATAFVGRRSLKTFAYTIYAASLLSLIGVLIHGTGPGDVKRWLTLGPLRFQPSELTKAGVISVMAVYLSTVTEKETRDLSKLLGTMLVSGVPVILIALEPDIGTAGVVLLSAGCLLLIAGLNKRTLLILTIAGIVAMPVVWKYGLKDYQKKRIETFLSPEKDPMGAGYQSIQSKITVGSGGLWGKGFRKGTQTQLRFLPEQHTDFAFSVWAEEWGFMGSLFVIAMYFFLALIYAEGAASAHSLDTLFLNAGVCIHITLHAFFNLGMVAGMLPVVGLPLPFFSYGGSTAIATALLMGLAEASKNVSLFDARL